MITKEEITRLEELFWTLDKTNVELAKSIAKGLGIHEIATLENTLQTLFEYTGEHISNFPVFVQKIRRGVYQFSYLNKEFEDFLIPFLAKQVQFLWLRNTYCFPKTPFPMFIFQLTNVRFLDLKDNFFDVQATHLEEFKFIELTTFKLGMAHLDTIFVLPKLEDLAIYNISSESVPILEQLSSFVRLRKLHLQFRIKEVETKHEAIYVHRVLTKIKKQYPHIIVSHEFLTILS